MHKKKPKPRKPQAKSVSLDQGEDQTVEKLGPYDGFLTTLVERFDQHLNRIKIEHNFDYGNEFEIAICEVLREVLPSRVGICRGFIVAEDGTKAGDDIVLFDAMRFPTLRLLGGDLARKEQVPVEAVLAYIEAKHTLYLDGDSGQSLAKALSQIAAVKRLKREPVGYRQMGLVELPSNYNVTIDSGWPAIRNPLLCAIWAPNVHTGNRGENAESLLRRTVELTGSLTDMKCADLIAAGRLLAAPATVTGPGRNAARPFLTSKTELMGSTYENRTLGLAVFYLMWAIEWIELGLMPWGRMLSWELRRVGVLKGTPIPIVPDATKNEA